MCIGSCAQLLAAGQRLKLYIHGGDSHDTPGFSGRYLKARPKKEQETAKREGEVFWRNVLKALEDQQDKAGPKATDLLKVFRDFCLSYTVHAHRYNPVNA